MTTKTKQLIRRYIKTTMRIYKIRYSQISTQDLSLDSQEVVYNYFVTINFLFIELVDVITFTT
jgi:hypothetical protein